jgi:NAD-dependent DNA ligase
MINITKLKAPELVKMLKNDKTLTKGQIELLESQLLKIAPKNAYFKSKAKMTQNKTPDFKDYKNLKASELVKILKDADNAYFNSGQAILTDYQYDEIKDYFKEKYPKNPYLKEIGFKPLDKLKVKLPYFLGSQDKIKYENKKELNSWISKFFNPLEYVISEKLDGISCLIVSSNDKDEIKLYTRGDGINGQDISKFKDFIKSIPKKLPKGVAIRGELLLSKSNWEKVKNEGVNARNLVAGVINSKTPNKLVLPLIDFVAYDLLSERISNFESLKKIKKMGFDVVKHTLIKKQLDNELLLELLKDFKTKSNYEIDGIVITHNKGYPVSNGKNPEFSFAFKSNSLVDKAEVIVTDVEWNISKDKYLKPIVKFDPVKLDGVVIRKATGFNADFIVKNKIGFGSIITIQRSGGVIPDIVEILKESDNGNAIMPNIPYKWNKTKIDIIADTEEKNREHDIKSYTFFMKSLEIKGVGEGIITKLYDNSYDTLKKIINITKDELIEIEGFKDKSADNVLNGLSEIKKKSCMEIMIASNLLGRGMGGKKLDLILSKFPFICTDKSKAKELTILEIKSINGMGDVGAQQFIENLNNFYDFYEDLGMNIKEPEKKQTENKKPMSKINKKLENKHFVFTGFRNKDFEKEIKDNNGYVDSTVTKTTNYLVIKDKTKITEKVKKAEEKGVIIITEEEFKDLL